MTKKRVLNLLMLVAVCTVVIMSVINAVIHSELIKSEAFGFCVVTIVFQIALVCALVVALIYLIKMIKREEEAYEDALKKRQVLLDREKQKVSNYEAELATLKNKEEELLVWQNDAIRAMPEIQEKIDILYAVDRATEFNEKYSGVEMYACNVKNYAEFDAAMIAYGLMSELEKGFVNIDMVTVAAKRDVTAERYAIYATNYIEGVCTTCFADKHTKKELCELERFYDNLPGSVKKLIPAHIVEMLKKMVEEAVKDYKNSLREASNKSFTSCRTRRLRKLMHRALY